MMKKKVMAQRKLMMVLSVDLSTSVIFAYLLLKSFRDT